MPNYPFEDVGGAFQNLGGSLQNIAVGLAQQRFQQDMARQQMLQHQMEFQQNAAMRRDQFRLMQENAASTQRLNEQHAALYAAQAALTKGKTTTPEQAAGEENILGDVVSYLARNPQLSPEEAAPYRAKALDIAGRHALRGQRYAPQNVSQVLEAINPASQRMLALGQKPVINVPAGATAIDIGQPQQPIFSSPRTLGAEASLVPGQGGEAIATGIARPGRDTQESKDFGRMSSIYRAIIEDPTIEDTDPLKAAAREGILRFHKRMQEGTTAPTGKPPAVKGLSPKEKAAQANARAQELRQVHPEWSDEELKAFIQREMH